MEATIRIIAFLGVFAAMAAWEAARPRRALADPRWTRWPANLGLVLLGAVAVRLVTGGAAVAATIFAAERGVGVLHWWSAPGWVAWIATLLVLDFAVYLQHVLFHAVPVLWRLHRVHHADLGFDASTGLRFHPIEILISIGLKTAVVVLLGSPTWAVVAFEILLNASSLFNHGNVTIPEALDRRLRWLVVTPDMHRIHHSRRAAETNSNFGFSVSWWDFLCGTYRADPALGQLGLEIGLAEYRRSLGLWDLLVLPFRGTAGAYTFADRLTRGAHGAFAYSHLGEVGHEAAAGESGWIPKSLFTVGVVATLALLPSILRRWRRPTTIDAADLRERLASSDPPLVLDVRSIEEWDGELGHIDGAWLVPLADLDRRIDELAAHKERLVVPV